MSFFTTCIEWGKAIMASVDHKSCINPQLIKM